MKNPGFLINQLTRVSDFVFTVLLHTMENKIGV